VPKVALRGPLAADLRAVFDAPDRVEADRRLKMAVENYAKTAPKLSQWLDDNLAEGLTVFALPPSHRRKLRTTNMLERLNKEIKRRTRVATLFPNDNSALRLVTAVLAEISDDWETEKRYLNMETI
jgi:putative transposase